MMMIREVLDKFQGASALPGSAGELITLTVLRFNWRLYNVATSRLKA